MLTTTYEGRAAAPGAAGAAGCGNALRALRAAALPRNKRLAAFELGGGKGLCSRGCTLGLTQDRATGAALASAVTRKRPELARELCAACREAEPDFRFTSIQVNLNTRYRMHTDGYDAGPSRMLCCGNFSGGRMWLHSWAERSWEAVDAHDHWVAFDGREFHLTEPWDGPERYSLVYFTHPTWANAELLRPGARALLEDLGFPWPQSEADTFSRVLPPSSERRPAAEADLPPEFLVAERALPAPGF